MENVLAAEFILRWLHFLFGFVWIGLLYYFNLVQVPSMPKIGAEAKAELFKEGSLVRTALFFFRWAAVGTVLVGLLLMYFNSKGAIIGPAFMLRGPFAGIGLGGYLGIIMMFNVWYFIWPNQKKVLGIVEATPEEKAKAGRIALLASRTNFMLSIPMLFFMESAAHGFQSMLGVSC
ncbi:MAG: urate hydroxylase PuuD [Candidatus Sericytochromatia bacterium]|nr:urate hydroxylase PuuD [Candidatus Tanganyikabacteria bacterium]